MLHDRYQRSMTIMHDGGTVHPDLVDLDRRLGGRLDRILEAEQEAAGLLARRAATLRDRLLDAEDSERTVSVTCVGGRVVTGRLAVVAADHLEVDTGDDDALVPFDRIAVVELL